MKFPTFAAAAFALATTVVVASAADDQPVKAPSVVAPIFAWTGLYVGAHLGWAWQNEVPSAIACNCAAMGGTGGMGTVPSYAADGLLGGLQAGYNYQFAGPWVIGIEGEFAWTALNGTAAWSMGGQPHTLSTRVKWIGDIAGRLGYAFDRTLLFVKGGWAWERADYEHTHLMAGAMMHDLTGSTDRNGWLVGLGIEHAFWPRVSLKVEWNYIDLGSDNVTVVQRPHSATFGFDSHVNIVKAGFNYRF